MTFAPGTSVIPPNVTIIRHDITVEFRRVGGVNGIVDDSRLSPTVTLDKKLSYRPGTARCVVSVEILPVATQQCSTTSPEQIEVMKLEY